MQMLDDAAATSDRYRALCAADGRQPFVCVTRNAWVGPTREDVVRDWYGGVVDFHLGYRRAGYMMPDPARSEEHTSELQSLMRISYAVFCLKKKKTNTTQHNILY